MCRSSKRAGLVQRGCWRSARGLALVRVRRTSPPEVSRSARVEEARPCSGAGQTRWGLQGAVLWGRCTGWSSASGLTSSPSSQASCPAGPPRASCTAARLGL